MPRKQRHSFLYRNGLTIAFPALMAVSPGGHLLAGWHLPFEEQLRLATPEPSWRSGFLSVVTLRLLSIHLQGKDSRQPKNAQARRSDTGA